MLSITERDVAERGWSRRAENGSMRAGSMAARELAARKPAARRMTITQNNSPGSFPCDRHSLAKEPDIRGRSIIIDNLEWSSYALFSALIANHHRTPTNNKTSPQENAAS